MNKRFKAAVLQLKYNMRTSTSLIKTMDKMQKINNP